MTRKNPWDEQRIPAVKAAPHEIFPGCFVLFVVQKGYHRYQLYGRITLFFSQIEHAFCFSGGAFDLTGFDKSDFCAQPDQLFDF